MELEKNFEKLEEIIKKLENKDMGLNEAFVLYSEGVQLVKECTDSIDKVEKQIVMLNTETVEENSSVFKEK